MVVSTNIEDGMILSVIPTNQFVVFLNEREEIISTVAVLLTFLDLCQKP